MIIKERNPEEHRETDKYSVAGAKAEEQMAFYLRRAFSEDPNIFVFNDLRFEDESGDAAQIDHLVLHRHGFVIIESKSVSTGVSVNEHGEWVRFWEGKPQGMPSPIQQAKLQGEFLRKGINEFAEKLLNKALFGLLQQRFGSCPFEVIVAISDKGSIKRGVEIPEVIKADQVCDRIREIYKRHKKAGSVVGVCTSSLKSNDGIYKFSDEEMQRISKFLTDYHCPLKPQKQSPPASVKEAPAAYTNPPTPAPKTAGLGICDKCGAQAEILWGKFSYYWKCRACENNMPIKEFCPTCKEKMKLRKQKNTFFIKCEPCAQETVYVDFG